MENTDTLLDFGDDSGSALSPTPQGGATVSATAGDPFDPFGGSAFDQANDLMSSDTLLPTAYDDSSDLFDPFAGPKMSAATTNGDLPPEQQQHYENQFADLLGDLGSSGTVQNGDIGGETITTVTKTTTEVHKDGETVTNTTITTETDSLLNDTNQTQESEGDAYNAEQNDAGQVVERATSTSTVRSVPQFEDTLADYQPPKRYLKKEEPKETKGPSVFITQTQQPPKDKTPKTFRFLGAGADNRCKKCDKRVYEMEKIIADKAIYHKPCFRCVHCNRVLSLGNYAAIDEKQYCKPHFIELFKKKGKYDMGKQPEKKDTTPRQEPAKEASQQQSSQPASTRVNGSVEDEQEGSKVNESIN